jgi:hypothetical protein
MLTRGVYSGHWGRDERGADPGLILGASDECGSHGTYNLAQIHPQSRRSGSVPCFSPGRKRYRYTVILDALIPYIQPEQ